MLKYKLTLRLKVAAWDAKARITEAKEQTKAITAVAKQKRIASQTWARILPTIALIVVSGVVLALVVIYRGRALVLFAQSGVLIPLFPELHRSHPPPDREAAP